MELILSLIIIEIALIGLGTDILIVEMGKEIIRKMKINSKEI